MKGLGISDTENFPFPTPPPPGALAQAAKVLLYIGALAAHREVSSKENKVSPN